VGEFYEFYTIREARAEINRLRCRLDEDDRAADQLIRERDHAESMADKLAAALATLLGVDIGEHSSGNCPWQEALDAFDERRPDKPPALPCGHPASLLLRSAETGEPLYCELCDDKSGRRDAEQCETELRAALRATDPTPQPSDALGWQPIETAPRNYTPILLRQDDAIGEGYYASHLRIWEFYNPAWMMRRAPTHWMPLPRATDPTAASR
jgi:hypothetical protein